MLSGKVEGMATPTPQSPKLEAASSAAIHLPKSIAIMARLRGPDGCPWDREQTFDSIKRHTLEETYEVFDAIERRAWPDLKDELGDLLLQVLFYAQMASEAGYFTIAGRCRQPERETHPPPSPHLRRSVEVADSDCRPAQLGADQAIREESVCESGQVVDARRYSSHACRPSWRQPSSAPAPRRSASTGRTPNGLFDKLQEEIGELKAELTPPSASQSHVAQSKPSSATSSSPRSISPGISRSIPNRRCAPRTQSSAAASPPWSPLQAVGTLWRPPRRRSWTYYGIRRRTPPASHQGS